MVEGCLLLTSKRSAENKTSLGFKEKENLQEWLVSNPSVFGEDLLIIQKEFSGFNDTKERIDLLALDKQGNLVIIENKLDDTGRDVVWQALKCASYCSRLSKHQIVLAEYPDAIIIDGCGGDGGKDALYVDISGERTIFQFKYFPGRLHSSQRQQIKKSLKVASNSSPDKWILLVPLDFDPKDLEWFESLSLFV